MQKIPCVDVVLRPLGVGPSFQLESLSPYPAGRGHGTFDLGRKAMVETSIGTIPIVKNMNDVCVSM